MEKRRLSLTNQDTQTKSFRLDGKVAVITGGGSGIGRAIALRFAANDRNLKRMQELTKDGYNRKMAPDLLNLVEQSKADVHTVWNDVSLRKSLVETLEVEKNRLGADTKMIAQNERERVMKEQFLKHFRLSSKAGTSGKVLLRFGRNHLHRGYDARDISTLGNFIAEFALEEGKKTFNVGAFWCGRSANRGREDL